MRLIDADALIEKHCEGCSDYLKEECRKNPVCATLDWVLDEPTIEAERCGRLRGVDYEDGKVSSVMIRDTDDEVKQFVQVTHCKDCKHWRDVGKEEKCCEMWYAVRSENDFCSAAERRE